MEEKVVDGENVRVGFRESSPAPVSLKEVSITVVGSVSGKGAGTSSSAWEKIMKYGCRLRLGIFWKEKFLSLWMTLTRKTFMTLVMIKRRKNKKKRGSILK